MCLIRIDFECNTTRNISFLLLDWTKILGFWLWWRLMFESNWYWSENMSFFLLWLIISVSKYVFPTLIAANSNNSWLDINARTASALDDAIDHLHNNSSVRFYLFPLLSNYGGDCLIPFSPSMFDPLRS